MMIRFEGKCRDCKASIEVESEDINQIKKFVELWDQMHDHPLNNDPRIQSYYSQEL